MSPWVRRLTFGSTGLWLNTAGGFVSVCLCLGEKLQQICVLSQEDVLTFSNICEQPSGQELSVCHASAHWAACSRYTSRWQERTAQSAADFLYWRMWAQCLTANSGIISPQFDSITQAEEENKADSQCCCSPSQRIKCSPRLNEIGLL